jgi:hypothetical protein
MRRVLLALLGGIAILAAGVAMRRPLIDMMLYHPMAGIDRAPERLGIDADEVFVVTEDGVRLHAYHLQAEGATRAILFLHGNAGNAAHRLPDAARLRRLGADVLLLDYRGYGHSEGSPSEAGLYADARAGLAHLTGTLGFDEQRVALFGRSLGGAVAVDLAQDRKLAGIILISTFSSLADVGSRHFTPIARIFAGRGYRAEEKIKRVRAPLLFFHGDRDRIVPFELGQRLFAAAPEPKAFETLSNTGHNDIVEIGGAAYFARIGAFLDGVAPTSSR